MTDKTEPQFEQLELQLEFTEVYEPVTDTVIKKSQIKLSNQQIKDGLIASMTVGAGSQGARNFVILLAIASHMDSNNKAFPSQTRLAEITGYSRSTVINAIKDLEQIEFGGQKILERKKVPSGANSKHFKTVYKFTAVDDADIPELQPVEPQADAAGEVAPLTARDVLLLFCEHYEAEFGVQYMPNFSRDISRIKQKLMGTFTDDQLRSIAEISVTHYRSKWANKQYPYPTVGQLCTWLANEAIKVTMQEKELDEQMEKRIAEADKYEGVDSLALLDSL